MNKRGFTLVELLAVIIILALLALLTSTAITKLVKDSKDELYNTQIELIESAAKSWGADNILKLPGNGQCSYLTLEDLKNYGLLDTNIVDPRTGEEISNDLKIKISTTLNTSKDGLITSYEIDPEDISRCNAIYEMYGDVNGDGVVDNIDYEYLNNYLLGTPGYETINSVASDANLDGLVDGKDVITLQRHLIGWEGFETLPVEE